MSAAMVSGISCFQLFIFPSIFRKQNGACKPGNPASTRQSHHKSRQPPIPSNRSRPVRTLPPGPYWSKCFHLWYYFDIAVLLMGKKIYKLFAKTFFLSIFISVAVPPVLKLPSKIQAVGNLFNHSNCLYMKEQQPSLAHRASGQDLPPEPIFQNKSTRITYFPVSTFFSEFTTSFSSSAPWTPPFLRFFSDLFDLKTYTILPYPLFKIVK